MRRTAMVLPLGTNLLTSEVMGILIRSLILLVIAYLTLRVTRYALSRLVARNVLTQTVAEQVYRPIQALVYILTIITLVYIVTQTPGLPYIWLAVLLVFLAANWSLIADMTAYYIIVSRKIRVGDYVEVDNVKGRIVSIDVLSTTIRDHQGNTIIIPNRILISKPLVRASRTTTSITLEVTVNMQEEVDLDQLESLIRDVLTKDKRLAVRPQDVEISILNVAGTKATLLVTVNIQMPHLRSPAINQLIRSLASKLKRYEPSIRVTGTSTHLHY